MRTPRKKAKCAAAQWVIQMDFVSRWKKFIQIMGPGENPA
jgi:hypothetical protein